MAGLVCRSCKELRAAARQLHLTSPAGSRSTRASLWDAVLAAAVSPVYMRSCDGRGCSRGVGARIRKRTLSPGQMEEIDRVCGGYPAVPAATA